MTNVFELEQQLGATRILFAHEVLSGLTSSPKQLPCKYFYDAAGSQLFEEICLLPEYYPTRTELHIMQQHKREMLDAIGRGSVLIEYGSGSSLKTRLLLDSARELAAYVPIDISESQLFEVARTLRKRYPALKVLPLCADYTSSYELPTDEIDGARRVVFFPGSTIGNFDPAGASQFLRHIASVCGPGGGLLIGVDLKKDPRVLAAAYNDSAGVTAAFNLNLLSRINRELGADFELSRFSHYAPYNPSEGRIEMHLVSLEHQMVHLCGLDLPFEIGESIHTENSYKYSLPHFERLARGAGLKVEQVWTDARQMFSIQYLTVLQ